MRKSHEKVARAFLAGQPAASGNLSTDGKVLLLHGNRVARWNDWTEEPDFIEATWATWVTVTTAAVVNAVAECAGSRIRFSRVDWEPCARNVEDGTTWRVEPDQWIAL